MNKLVLALSFVMLAACGESKITEVDGTSVASAEKSLQAMGKIFNENDSIAYNLKVKMLHTRYKGDDFARAVDGKDMDGLNKVFDDTTAYFLAINRERFVQIEQVQIDRLTAKVAKMTELRQSMENDFDPETSIWTSRDLSEIKLRKAKQEEYRTQDGATFLSIHGCGCEQAAFKATAKPF